MNTIRISLQGILGFPVRSLLSVLSLLLGIVSIVTIYSATLTIEATVTQKALLTGGPISTFDIAESTGFNTIESTRILSGQLEEYIGQSGGVAQMATSSQVALELNGKILDAQISFTDSNLIRIRKFPVLEGVWLETIGHLRPALVINVPLKNSLENSFNDQLKIVDNATNDRDPVRIIGVIDDGNTTPYAYGSLLDLSNLLMNQENSVTNSIQLTSPHVSTDELVRRIGEINEFSGRESVWTITRRDTVGELEGELNATRSTFFTIGFLAILTTIFAISNIGLSTIRERSSELSLRRALGAKWWQIPMIMVIEGQLIALGAAILAVPVALTLYPIIANQFGAPFGIDAPPFPWIAALVGLLVGMSTALLGSLLPATRSLKIPISSMMRD